PLRPLPSRSSASPRSASTSGTTRASNVSSVSSTHSSTKRAGHGRPVRMRAIRSLSSGEEEPPRVAGASGDGAVATGAGAVAVKQAARTVADIRGGRAGERDLAALREGLLAAQKQLDRIDRGIVTDRKGQWVEDKDGLSLDMLPEPTSQAVV